jgi:hypothetical protein
LRFLKIEFNGSNKESQRYKCYEIGDSIIPDYEFVYVDEGFNSGSGLLYELKEKLEAWYKEFIDGMLKERKEIFDKTQKRIKKEEERDERKELERLKKKFEK